MLLWFFSVYKRIKERLKKVQNVQNCIYKMLQNILWMTFHHCHLHLIIRNQKCCPWASECGIVCVLLSFLACAQYLRTWFHNIKVNKSSLITECVMCKSLHHGATQLGSHSLTSRKCKVQLKWNISKLKHYYVQCRSGVTGENSPGVIRRSYQVWWPLEDLTSCDVLCCFMVGYLSKRQIFNVPY